MGVRAGAARGACLSTISAHGRALKLARGTGARSTLVLLSTISAHGRALKLTPAAPRRQPPRHLSTISAHGRALKLARATVDQAIIGGFQQFRLTVEH